MSFLSFEELNIPSRGQLLEQMFMGAVQKAIDNKEMHILFREELPKDFIEFLQSKGYDAKNGQFIEHSNGNISEPYDFYEYHRDDQYHCYIDLTKEYDQRISTNYDDY